MYITKKEKEKLNKLLGIEKDEEKQGEQASSAASAPKKAAETKKETKKLLDSPYIKKSYSTPFSSVAENLKREKEAEKQAEKHTQNVVKYATGQIDSTVAENMGVNTREIDNYIQERKNQAFKNQEQRKLATIDDSTLERLGYDSYGLQKAKEDAKKVEKKTNDFITASRRYNDIKDYMNDYGELKLFAVEKYRQEKAKSEDIHNQAIFPYQTRIDLESEIVDRYQNKLQSYYDLVDGNPEFEDYTTLHNFSNIYDAMNSFFLEKYGVVDKNGKKYLPYNTFDEWNYIYDNTKFNKPLITSVSTQNLPQKILSAMETSTQAAMDKIANNYIIPNNHGQKYLSALRKSADNPFEKVAIDVSSAFGNILPSLFLGQAVPGAKSKDVAALTNFLNESQSTYNDQIRKGFSYSEARAMGVLTGGINAYLEKKLGNIPGMSDSADGIISGLTKNQISNIESGIRKSVKNPALRAMLIGGGKTAVSFLDEGAEEYIQDAIAAPVIEAVVKGQLPEFALASPDAIESFVVGGILGGTLNLPSNISETISNINNPSNIETDMPQIDAYSAPFEQITPQNTENVVSAFNVGENNNSSDKKYNTDLNALTWQNRGVLDGIEKYSEETQSTLSKLTPAGRELILSGKMSAAQIDALANEINDPTSENNSKSARRERIKNALDEVNRDKIIEENNSNPDNVQIDPKKHDLKQQKTIIEYNNSVDESILDYIIERKKRGGNKYSKRFGNINSKIIADIKNKVGIDVTGYKFELSPIALEHIEIDHGTNGKSDQSMANINNIARIKYIMENYDDIGDPKENDKYSYKYMNSDNTPSKKIVISKKIDGTYYVVEAVPDSKRKVIGVETAYITKNNNKKTEVPKSLHEEKSSRIVTPETSHGYASVDNSITQPDTTVNPENSQNSTPRPQVEGILRRRVEGILTPATQNSNVAQPGTDNGATVPTTPPTDPDESTHQQIIKTSEDVKRENKASFKAKFSDAIRRLKNEITTTSESFERADKKNGSNLTNRFYDAKASKYVADYNITEGQTDINGNEIGKGLNEIFSRFYEKVKRNKRGEFKGFKGDIADSDYFARVTNYVYAKHNIERSAEGKGFLSDELAWTPKQIAEFEANNPDAVEFQKELTQYYRNMLENSVSAGLISRVDADAFEAKYPNYVPTQRMVDNKGETKNMEAMASGDIVEMLQGEGLPSNGYSVSTGIRTAGDNKTLDLMPLYEQAQARTYSFVKNQMRNSFSNAVAMESANIDDVLSIQEIDTRQFREIAPNEVVFYRDGKKYAMRISDYMRYGFNELYNKGERNIIEQVAGGIMTPFKALITELDPTFMIRNTERDWQDAGIYTKDFAAFSGSIPDALAEMVNNGELWKLYRAKGGMSNYRLDKNNRYKQSNKLSQAQQIVEQIPRFVEFYATIKKGGMSETNIRQAMQNARDITVNFQRGGRSTKFLNRTFVPFLNPSVQGLSKTIRTFTDIAEGNSNVSKAEAALNIVKKSAVLGARLAALGIAPSFINELFLHDDEEYQKIDERIKQSYYIFKVGDTKFLYAPKGRLVSVVGEFGRDVVKLWNEEEISVLDFLSNVANQQGVTDPVDNNIFAPLYRVAQNKTWYGGSIENPYDVTGNGVKPFNERYDPSTTEWAKGLSNMAYAAAKGLGIEGKVELGPKRIENLVDSYGGVFADIAFAMGRKTKNNSGGSLIGKDDDKFRYAKGLVSAVGDKFLLDTGVKTNIPGKYYDMLKKYNSTGNSDNATGVDKFMKAYFDDSTEISEANKAYSSAKQSGNVDTTRNAKSALDGLMSEKMDNAPKYREAAEKVLANYPDFDYANATEKEKTYIQLQIDKEFGGSEYALQKNLNKESYEKAQENNSAHGLSYDDIYAYCLEKQTLPKDISEKDELEHMENWLLNTKDVSSKEAKNALGTAYLKDVTVLTDTYDYDFTDKSSMTISKMDNTKEAKYYKAKQVFGNISPEAYEHYAAAYNSGQTKEEKMSALRAAGLDEASAKAFYGIQSGQKAYKTGVTGTETRLRKEMNFHSSDAEEIVRRYEDIFNSDPKKERELQTNFVRKIVKKLNPEYISYFGGEDATVSRIMAILDDM